MLIYKAFGWVQHLQNLTFSDLNSIKIQIRLRACRRPSILSPVKPLRHQTLETPFRRFNKVPIPWGGPKGTQGNSRVPKGTQGYLRAPSAPLGGMGPRGPLGLYRSHSEWNPFRLNGYYETTPKLKPWLESRLKGKVSKYYQNLLKIRVALGPK